MNDSTTNANTNAENCNDENLTLKKKLQTLNQLITLKEELVTEKKPEKAKNECKKATTLKKNQNFDSYSISEDEETETKGVKTELKVDETQISSKAEFGSLAVSNDKNIVHKNIDDDDDDEENLSDYFNDDEDEVEKTHII